MNLRSSAFPTNWFVLASPPGNTSVPKGNSIDVGGKVSVSYSSAVFLESDIAPLTVTAISGKAKFLPDLSGDAGAAIGYVISVSAAPLDRSKLPEKYRTER